MGQHPDDHPLTPSPAHPLTPSPPHAQSLPAQGRTVLFLAVCCLGVSAFMTQLTLMRELVSVFSGNELVFGIVLGNWLLLTGIGSALGKTAAGLKSPVTVLVVAQIIVALLPIADVFLLRALQNETLQRDLFLGHVWFIRGAEVGVIQTVVSSFILLAPYCLLAGYLLALSCLILSGERGPASIGQVYFLDNVGDVLGGLLFTFVLVYVFQHFGILCFPAVLNLAFAGLVALWFRRPILLAAAIVALAALSALMATCDLEELSTRIQYAGQHVVHRGNSPYGNLIVTEQAGQYSFIENGVPLFSTHNLEQREETVHYAMAQRPQARRVLLISGGVSGTAREILKYPLASVDYAELDPMIIEVARRYVPENLDDPRIHVFNTDGRLLVKQADVTRAERRYDVVIVDVPDPLTFQINRFYTQEFFQEVRRVLTPDGVLSFSLGQYGDYLGPEAASLIATAERTLRQVYDNVLIIPGGKVFFLASDGELTIDVAQRLEAARINTRWVNRDYLKATLTEDRLADVRRVLSDEAPVNKDFSPILYYYRLRLWMSQFKVRFGLLEAALLLLLLVYLLRIRPVPLAIFTTGFAASALEVVLLVGFQILYGCVYRQVGLIVTMFMLGLGIGSWAMNRRMAKVQGSMSNAEIPKSPNPAKGLAKLVLAVAAYALCLPLVLLALEALAGTALQEWSAAGDWAPTAGWFSTAAAQVVIPAATLLLAVLVGLEFPLAGRAVLAGAGEGSKVQGSRFNVQSPIPNPQSPIPNPQSLIPIPSDAPRTPATDFHAVTAAAARLYTADYVGAALGALLVSTLLIPVIGVAAVCLLAAGLNLLSGAVLLVTARR
jgi:spermidine synthase